MAFGLKRAGDVDSFAAPVRAGGRTGETLIEAMPAGRPEDVGLDLEFGWVGVLDNA